MKARPLLIATIGKLPSQAHDSYGKRLRKLASWTPPDVTGGVLMFALDLGSSIAPDPNRRTWYAHVLATMNSAADAADQEERSKEMGSWETDYAGSRALALLRVWADEAERIPEERVFAAHLRSEIGAMLGHPTTGTNARLLLIATISKLPSQAHDSYGERLRKLASWTPPDVPGGVLMSALDLGHDLAPDSGRRTWYAHVLATMNSAADAADQEERSKEMGSWETDYAGSRAIALLRAWADEAERIPEERVFAAHLRNEIGAMLA